MRSGHLREWSDAAALTDITLGRTLNCDHERHADAHEKEQVENMISVLCFRMNEGEKSIKDFSPSVNDTSSFSRAEA